MSQAKAKKSNTSKKVQDVVKAPAKPATPEVASTPVAEPLPQPVAMLPRLAELTWLAAIVFLVAVLVGGFELVYHGKVYPGVQAEGVYLGGLTRDQAVSAVQAQVNRTTTTPLSISYGATSIQLPVSSLTPQSNVQLSVNQALAFGRNANWLTRLHQQARALFARSTNFSNISIDPTKLSPYFEQIETDIARPVANAQFDFAGQDVTVKPAKAGQRLDRGRLTIAIENALANGGSQTIAAPYYRLAPVVETTELVAIKDQAASFVASPMTIKRGSNVQTLDAGTIIGWLSVSTGTPTEIVPAFPLTNYYNVSNRATFGVDDAKLIAYVADLAAKTDRTAQNAALTIADGKATVFQPSHDGAKLDQADAVAKIKAALALGSNRQAELKVATVKADISEDSLNNLGINELISEGVTYFPGSPSTRLINVRTGAAKFNGILLKPDEVFSFGALLGDVGPEQGYVPELVILVDHEEKQYGGGLCQVSSTAFRAALQAGLPILERHNHSFAISYYTNPYGVPGVDATIYYPQVDFKFKNDTGHYILIQTIMQGTTLKFDFYGTKTKSGVIRGPQFITGTNDNTKPSHTVFWRDILDLSGNVVKTDQFDTYYKPSTDFPITKQFN